MTSSRAAPPTLIHDAGSAVRELVTVRASDWDGKPIPERRWLVRGMIPEGVVTMLNGDGGVGKSLLALQGAAAVAGGFDWIGTMPENGPVLYLSAEDELDEHHRRADDIVRARSVSLKALCDLHIVSLAGEDAVLAAPDGRSGILAPTPLWRGLEKRVGELRPRLVVLDNLADVFGGNEVARNEARQFIGILRGMAIHYATSILLLAHPSLSGLNSGSGTSGSTAWNNSVRSRLYLDRPKSKDDKDADPDQRVLRQMKANHAAIGGETKLRWQAGVFELEGGATTGFSRAAAEAEAERVFLVLLGRFTTQGRDVSHKPSPSYAPTVFAREQDNGGVQKKAFERAMSALFKAESIRVEVSGSPSRRRSRIVAT